MRSRANLILVSRVHIMSGKLQELTLYRLHMLLQWSSQSRCPTAILCFVSPSHSLYPAESVSEHTAFLHSDCNRFATAVKCHQCLWFILVCAVHHCEVGPTTQPPHDC